MVDTLTIHEEHSATGPRWPGFQFLTAVVSSDETIWASILASEALQTASWTNLYLAKIHYPLKGQVRTSNVFTIQVAYAFLRLSSSYPYILSRHTMTPRKATSLSLGCSHSIYFMPTIPTINMSFGELKKIPSCWGNMRAREHAVDLVGI